MAGFCTENNLLPHIIDHYAQESPDKVYAEYPRSPDTYKDGFSPVTYRSLANAINGISRWLISCLGPGNGEALAYVGTNDIRYPALVIGAIKAGYCIFLVSPRNSMAAFEELFKSTNCTRFVVQDPPLPPANAIIDRLSMQSITVPSVEELLSTEYPHVEYRKTYPEDRNDTMAIVHTSGSTGIPKPIIWPLEVANKHIRMSNLQPPSGFSTLAQMFGGSKLFLTLPPFHAAGIGILIFVALPSSLTLVIPISAALPTATSFVEAAKTTDIKSAILPPFIIKELAHDEKLLDYCSQNLDFLFYGGGDLPQPIGNKIAERMKLANLYGASELGILGALFSLSGHDYTKDWKYVSLHPEVGGEFRHVMEDKHELVLVRSQERERHQMPFAIFPELKEYPTRDLFIRHPDPKKSDLWRWCSRVDDVIVFLNGEKTNPVSMEQHITASNKGVTGALVAGTQRFQASLIVEYGDKALDASERAKVIEELWPSIEEANSVCPAHAQISRTHILFTTPDKPMSRAGKGTIQRPPTLALYQSELDALYADADLLETASVAKDPFGTKPIQNIQQISDLIREVLVYVTGWSEDQVIKATDFFRLGFDSLKAITASRLIMRSLRLPTFTPNVIYLNSSLASLSAAALQMIHDHENSDTLMKAERLKERQELSERMLSRIQHISNEPELIRPHSQTIILTGSTGMLGSYLLDSLLKDPTVSHVHCLNRRENGRSIQGEKSSFYNLNSSFDPDRVSFWHVDLCQENLGLDTEMFKILQETTTAIIHNAWNVNFNLSFPSFEPDLIGLVNLLNFTSSSATQPHLFFVSSMGAVFGHSDGSNLTPEALVTMDPSPNGYGNSKYVAEHLVDYAVKANNIKASVVRAGQIAGAINSPGLWNPKEWLPSLVMSSKKIGAIPQHLGSFVDQVDWVPVDLLADVLVDLALNKAWVPGRTQFFHPLNLHPKPWEDVAPIISKVLASFTGRSLEMVPLSDWIQRVRKDMESASGEDGASDELLRENLEKNPAAKLLGFFAGLNSAETHTRLETHETASKSDKLCAIDGVKESWIAKWIHEWMA